MLMTIVSALLYTVAVLIAILLICLVLVQPAKGGGFGAAFGGIGEGVFGAQTMGHLSKLTIYLISAFFVVTLLIAAIAGHKINNTATASKSAAVVTAEQKTDKKAQPAAKPADKKAQPAAKPADKKAQPAAKPADKKAQPAAKPADKKAQPAAKK